MDKVIYTQQHDIANKQSGLNLAFENLLNQRYYDLGLMENTLIKINPLNILNKGFAKVEQSGQSISSKKQLNLNSSIHVIFKDGKITADIKGE